MKYIENYNSSRCYKYENFWKFRKIDEILKLNLNNYKIRYVKRIRIMN